MQRDSQWPSSTRINIRSKHSAGGMAQDSKQILKNKRDEAWNHFYCTHAICAKSSQAET